MHEPRSDDISADMLYGDFRPWDAGYCPSGDSETYSADGLLLNGASKYLWANFALLNDQYSLLATDKVRTI